MFHRNLHNTNNIIQNLLDKNVIAMIMGINMELVNMKIKINTKYLHLILVLKKNWIRDLSKRSIRMKVKVKLKK